MAILARSDIAQVGASRCVRESECSEAFIKTIRRSIGCTYVTVRFYCAYAVRTTDGNAGTAFAKIYSNPAKPLQVEQPSFHEANEIECKVGFGCKPAAGAEPGGPAGASARKDTTPPPPHEAAACKGLRVEVVGAGETCLDPGDPARRDFRDCNNGFCGPAMVALPKGRGMRGSSAADMARLSKDDPQADPSGARRRSARSRSDINWRSANSRSRSMSGTSASPTADASAGPRIQGTGHAAHGPSCMFRGSRRARSFCRGSTASSAFQERAPIVC